MSFLFAWLAIAVLWIEFVREVRWCWEESQPLPRMPTNGVIDLSTCLVNQKLHMVIVHVLTQISLIGFVPCAYVVHFCCVKWASWKTTCFVCHSPLKNVSLDSLESLFLYSWLAKLWHDLQLVSKLISGLCSMFVLTEGIVPLIASDWSLNFLHQEC